ncbi:TetR family transcriptional regulator [Amycolatopsis antarctica]|uniref:TetR family transcriptional regulator n=1 Tax=Amycolatopsis antarctica TaxID=1854586 RepID=A0A263CZE9_9PSEU|nr:TetR family transcriptional regulator [Amycolatopsis antarctica]
MLGAARRVFAEHGPRAGTIEQIARAAGVSRQAVYDRFRDRATLVDAVVREIGEEAFAAIGAPAARWADPDLRAWTRANYAAMFTFVAEHPEAMPLLQEAERTGDPALTRLRGRLAEVYAKAVRARFAAHGVRTGGGDRALVAMYFAMTEALVGLADGGDAAEREAFIDLLTEFTVGGVLRLYEHAPGVLDRLRGQET